MTRREKPLRSAMCATVGTGRRVQAATSKRVALGFGVALTVAACGAKKPVSVAKTPDTSPAAAEAAETAPPTAQQGALGPWAHTLGRNHPLTGRIWSSGDSTWLAPETLFSRLRDAPWVFLGEKHDNRDHHRLQALVLRQLVKGRKDVAVGFEMLRVDTAASVAAAKSTDALRVASDWDRSGWPAFSMYAPLFDALYSNGLQPLAVHPSRPQMMDVARSGGRNVTLPALPAEAQATLAKDIKDAHCGHGGDSMVQMMTVAQRYKDVTMVKGLEAADASVKQRVLVAGNGHVRTDYGAPTLVSGAVSIGFIEVAAERIEPDKYPTGIYDYLWFTPRVDDDDPCVKFKEQLERMRDRMRRRKHTAFFTPAP